MIETCSTTVRRFQFGIKALLAIALLVCVCCGVTGWSLIQHPLDFAGRCGLLAGVHLAVMWSLLEGGVLKVRKKVQEFDTPHGGNYIRSVE
jgi:hypothetical protein